MGIKIKIRTAKNGQPYIRVDDAESGESLLISETYFSKSNAQRAAEHLKGSGDELREAEIVDETEAE